MKVRLVDIETTGQQSDPDPRICELGFIDLNVDSLEISNPFTMLINPLQPMPPQVSAIHHLIDEDLADAGHVFEAICALNRGMEDGDLFAAHNKKFEQFFIPTKRRWICTYLCATRAWQDAPGHGNSTLRYYLKLQLDRARADPPHRALPDAYVSAHILRELLKLRPIDRLLEISEEPLIQKNIGFGEHKGKPWREVPSGYIDWVINKSNMSQEIKDNAKYWKEKIVGRVDGN